MSKLYKPTAPRAPQRGFTLVELMVTVAIAVFLLFGLVKVVENIRGANSNQQALALLQDEQRFAMTVLTDVIQQGGYFPTTAPPQTYTPISALPLFSGPQGWEVYPVAQAFVGSHPAAAGPDTIGVRYRTALNDGVILCDGSTNTTFAPDQYYASQFYVVPPVGNTPGQLMCQLSVGTNTNAAVSLITGLQSMVIWYGVNRTSPSTTYNIDTYLTADQMCSNAASPCGFDDWSNISSVRVQLTFVNPLFPQPGQPATIVIERVIQVMARAGVHT
jgi:type IV pilus assembly protein PilW